MKKIIPGSEYQITNVAVILHKTQIMWKKMFYLFNMFFNIMVHNKVRAEELREMRDLYSLRQLFHNYRYSILTGPIKLKELLVFPVEQLHFDYTKRK